MANLANIETPLRDYLDGKTLSFQYDKDALAGTPLEALAELVERLAAENAGHAHRADAFLANVSHELRTPLTVLTGYVEDLLAGDVPPSRQTEILGVLDNELKRLNQTVSSMLHLTELEAGTRPLQAHRCTWNDLAFSFLLLFQSRLERKDIAVSGLDGTPLQIVADPDLLGQVVYNLIENAIKYTPAHGEIRFRFSETAQVWEMRVENTGTIPDADRARLFGRFFRSASAKEADPTGVGLGLYLARRLMQLQGGGVHLEEGAAGTSVFVVTLPKKDDGK